MTLAVWLTYIATVLLLMSTPGPSHLLMLTNSISHGFRRSLATAAGDLSANLLQMLAAGLGLAAILAASEIAFTIVKWLGVAYLIWLGLNLILSKAKSIEDGHAEPKPLMQFWLQGFVTSAANPKAVVFFASLFPLFISPEVAFWPQFAILSVSYIFIDGCFLSAYGSGAAWIAKRLAGPRRALLNRIGGGALIGAAALLGAKALQET